MPPELEGGGGGEVFLDFFFFGFDVVNGGRMPSFMRCLERMAQTLRYHNQARQDMIRKCSIALESPFFLTRVYHKLFTKYQ